MTPLQINMMLHYYVSFEPYSAHAPDHANSKAVLEQREALVNYGMLRFEPANVSEYSVTEKGMCYINFLRSVPVPSMVYQIKMENTNEA